MVKYREPNKYDNKDHQVGPPTVTRGLPPPSPPAGKRLWSQDSGLLWRPGSPWALAVGSSWRRHTLRSQLISSQCLFSASSHWTVFWKTTTVWYQCISLWTSYCLWGSALRQLSIFQSKLLSHPKMRKRFFLDFLHFQSTSDIHTQFQRVTRKELGQIHNRQFISDWEAEKWELVWYWESHFFLPSVPSRWSYQAPWERFRIYT